jgi:hypothetical protein
LAAYPAITWAQASTLLEDEIDATVESSDDTQEQSKSPLYGWEPTMYPDPIEDPSRCGISYLIDGSNVGDFEFASTNTARRPPNPVMTNTRLCDPDFVLGGAYLEQTAAALATFSDKFSHPETNIGVDASSPPTWPFWQGRRTLVSQSNNGGSRLHVRILEAAGSHGRSNGWGAQDVDGWIRHKTLSTSLNHGARMNMESSGDIPLQSENQPSQQDVGVTTVDSKPDHVGLIVEEASSDDDDRARANRKRKKEEDSLVRPPIELAVATARKVRMFV